MSESGHQKITRVLQQFDAQEHEVRTLAQQVSEATGTRDDAVVTRWRQQALDEVHAALRQRFPRYSGGVGRECDRDVERRLLPIAQGEWDATLRERNRPTAADYQEKYHRRTGTWSTLREMEEAGY